MDSSIGAAARALGAGDPLAALKRIALRDDAPALALRGAAMAQLGDYARARDLFRRATKGFGKKEALFRARCLAAEAEVALAARDLDGSGRQLATAIETLERLGDGDNAEWAKLVSVRRHLLIGQIERAEQELLRFDPSAAPPVLVAVAELARAEIAERALDAPAARSALTRAREAAQRSRVPALIGEVERGVERLGRPCARFSRDGVTRAITLDEVRALFESETLVLDACRRALRFKTRIISLARRPVLFALARELWEAFPSEAPRDALIRSVFGARAVNDSHRARLRVEIGRLRAALRELSEIQSTDGGFALVPKRRRAVALLVPPIDGADASILALLEDGEAWSTTSLALALGASQRTLQRALKELERSEKVRSLGRGRAQRWLGPPLGGFATTLLLPGFATSR